MNEKLFNEILDEARKAFPSNLGQGVVNWISSKYKHILEEGQDCEHCQKGFK